MGWAGGAAATAVIIISRTADAGLWRAGIYRLSGWTLRADPIFATSTNSRQIGEARAIAGTQDLRVLVGTIVASPAGPAGSIFFDKAFIANALIQRRRVVAARTVAGTRINLIVRAVVCRLAHGAAVQ